MFVLGRLLLMSAALAVGAACMPPTEEGGSTRDASAQLDQGAPDSGGAGVGDGPPPGACVETLLKPAAADTTLTLNVEVTIAGKPAVFGEKNVLVDGATVMPGNVRFYLSDPFLIDAAGAKVPALLVAANGAPQPYNVQLVNLEAPATQMLRLAAPHGSYRGVGFIFGVNDACNGANPFLLKAPLTPDSQMTWPHEAGYLFLRYEGAAMAAAGQPASSAPPAAVHMGGRVGVRFAPVVQASAALELAAGASQGPVVRVSLDEVWRGAQLPADLTGFDGAPTPEVKAGEHLRRNFGAVQVFSIVPAGATTP